MFIDINGKNYNIDKIKSYQNLWKKDGKEYKKNGSQIELEDGELLYADYHVEIEEEQIPPTIIPALEGYEIIVRCQEDDGSTSFIFEPVIAWKIDSSYITPVSIGTSWEDFSNSIHSVFRNVKTGEVHSTCQTWNNIEKYKEHLAKKGQ